MVAYVEYEYYKTKYKGAAIPADAFEEIARDASVFVREITFNRIKENTTEDVKDAVCAVCDVYFTEKVTLQKSGGKEVKSVNTDGYSVTYVSEGVEGQLREKVLYQKAYSAARPHLIHTGLLYRGCH